MTRECLAFATGERSSRCGLLEAGLRMVLGVPHCHFAALMPALVMADLAVKLIQGTWNMVAQTGELGGNDRSAALGRGMALHAGLGTAHTDEFVVVLMASAAVGFRGAAITAFAIVALI